MNRPRIAPIRPAAEPVPELSDADKLAALQGQMQVLGLGLCVVLRREGRIRISPAEAERIRAEQPNIRQRLDESGAMIFELAPSRVAPEAPIVATRLHTEGSTRR